ncbi:MAG: diadenylate cyclase CdaA [Chloroflexota bacterium]
MTDIFRIGFLHISIIDVFDIALSSVLFYWVYRALKNTVALQILFGLVIIIGLSFITEAVNMRSMNWILRTISDIWLLAFIILFQPELRKMLLMLTRSSIFRVFVKSRIAQTLDEVIDAALEMSEKHIGALIVFTRSQNVQMRIDTGIRMQAAVSRELLLSIFNPKSPLHDGAVIIDNQMILAARCVLPLTGISKIKGKNLGTRHRAALGLSEQVDALALIVSEETGWISIADGGDLMLNISHDQLPTVLKSKLEE